jgi:hypothetical protein
MKNFILVIAILFLYSCHSNYNRSVCKNENYRGVITKKYEMLMNHNMWTFDIHGDNYSINEVNYSFKTNVGVFPRCWDYAEVGDSVIKKKDSLYLRIKKPNGNNQIFYYH